MMVDQGERWNIPPQLKGHEEKNENSLYIFTIFIFIVVLKETPLKLNYGSSTMIHLHVFPQLTFQY